MSVPQLVAAVVGALLAGAGGSMAGEPAATVTAGGAGALVAGYAQRVLTHWREDLAERRALGQAIEANTKAAERLTEEIQCDRMRA